MRLLCARTPRARLSMRGIRTRHDLRGFESSGAAKWRIVNNELKGTFVDCSIPLGRRVQDLIGFRAQDSVERRQLADP